MGQYHIRVLIPCYKEPEEIVRQTVAAIRSAVLPPGELPLLPLAQAWQFARPKGTQTQTAAEDLACCVV